MMDSNLNLKFMLLNAENLFLLSDQKLTEDHLLLEENQWQKLSTSVFENKPLRKLQHLKKVVDEIQPDILMLAEVGGLESLSYFNQLFLKNKYSPALIEGNSDRNIDVGYLIKKDLNFYFDIVSNKNRPIDYIYPHDKMSGQNISLKFSRDVVELHLFHKNRENPFLICLLTHLKSRLDPDGIDPNGFERRQAEFKTLLEIYSEMESKFQRKVPVVVSGDFNGNASRRSTDAEFKILYETTELKEVCELAQLKDEETATYYQVSRSSRSEGKQIDFAFLSPLAQKYLDPKSVFVYRYKDHLGMTFDPPTSIDAKTLLPSDHYPLIFCLQNIPRNP